MIAVFASRINHGRVQTALGRSEKSLDQSTRAALRDLQRIPGVGPSIARDLLALGITRVAQLRGRSPEQLYARSCKLAGQPIDRCLLYTYRCAVYFASETAPDPDRLKWWNWTDRPAARAKKKAGRSVPRSRAR